jgi:hypothetical protein
MEEATGTRLDLILKRLPAALACAAFALAASLDWELPWLGDLAAGAALLVALWLLVGAAQRFVFTPAGIIRWHWLLWVVLAAVMVRYGLPLFASVFSLRVCAAPGPVCDAPRMVLWGLGVAFALRAIDMARERWRAGGEEAETGAEEGEREALDRHRDLERHQAAFVLFALGLALLQMS